MPQGNGNGPPFIPPGQSGNAPPSGPPGRSSAPTDILLDNQSVDENLINALIAAITVIDADVGDSHTFSVDDARFEIIGGNLQLAPGQGLNHEAEGAVTLTITAVDGFGLTFAKAFVITVNDVNEAPTDIVLSASNVDENVDGAVVGALSVVDPDALDSHTFTVSDNRFEVVTGTLKLKADESLDYETEPSVAVEVTATDLGGLAISETFALTVNDVPELAIGPRLQLNSQTSNLQLHPSIAHLANGNIVVSWTNGLHFGETVSVRVFDPTGAPVGDQFQVGAVGAEQSEVAALADGGFVIAWSTGDFGNVFLQRFDASGRAIDAAPVTVNAGINGVPEIAVFADNSFMIVYQDDGGGSDNVRGRLYDAAGVGGPEFAIATEAGHQVVPEIALLSNGNLAVSYASGPDGGVHDRFLRILQPDGTVVTTVPIALNTSFHSQVVARTDGKFVVTWSDGDVHARIFQNDGAPVGGEVLVNTTTAGMQNDHGLIGLPDGGFFVAWLPDALPGAVQGPLLGQRFDSAGQFVGDEIIIDAAFDNFTNHGSFPGMVVLADGAIFIAYSGSFVGDADPDYAIAGRVISLDGAVTSTSVPIAAAGLLTSAAAGGEDGFIFAGSGSGTSVVAAVAISSEAPAAFDAATFNGDIEISVGFDVVFAHGLSGVGGRAFDAALAEDCLL